MTVLRVGTTEGRFRMIMPELMQEFHRDCPEVRLEGVIGNAEQLREMLTAGELDLAFSGISPLDSELFRMEMIFDEHLYFVISDGLLRRYFPDDSEAVLARWAEHGTDLGELAERKVPFSKSLPNLHCMQILDAQCAAAGTELDCIHQSGHFDLHMEMAQRDLAACFCLSMYVPHFEMLNRRAQELPAPGNRLYRFPVCGLTATNPVFLLHLKTQSISPSGEVFRKLLLRKCEEIGP